MSFCNETTVAKSRKAHRCDLCGELVPKGSPYVRRSGVAADNDGFFAMTMHPECVAHENSMPWHDREDWYENIGEPLFDRADALRWYAQNVSPFVVTTPDVPLGKQLYVSRLREGTK